MMSKQTIKSLSTDIAALMDLRRGLEGQPFTWGAHEADSKETILKCLGYALASRTKLEKGGQELKRGAKAVGKRYYNAPLKRYADLYLLGVQTRRSSKFWALADKGKALLEDGRPYNLKESLLCGPLVPKELVAEVEAVIRPILKAHKATESEATHEHE